jgi:hypothetical protein
MEYIKLTTFGHVIIDRRCSMYQTLKGLSHVMDLAFDDMQGEFEA